MIKVTVAQTTVRRMKGIGKVSGKPYDMQMQTVYLHTVDRDGNTPPYPEKSEVILEADAAPYAVGDYSMHPSSVYVDRQGNASLSMRLVPWKTAAPVPKTA